MTIATTDQLFSVTIRRTYTPAHLNRWGGPEFTDRAHPEWGESAEAIVAQWADIHANQSAYWLERFRDEVLMVEPLDADQLRAEAAAHHQSDLRCCDLAIVRPCVCMVSFTCPKHGVRCHGTHD